MSMDSKQPPSSRGRALGEYFETTLDREARAAEPPDYDQLAAYVEGTLDDVDREIVESWLEADPALRAEVEDLRALREAMGEPAGRSCGRAARGPPSGPPARPACCRSRILRRGVTTSRFRTATCLARSPPRRLRGLTWWWFYRRASTTPAWRGDGFPVGTAADSRAAPPVPLRAGTPQSPHRRNEPPGRTRTDTRLAGGRLSRRARRGPVVTAWMRPARSPVCR